MLNRLGWDLLYITQKFEKERTGTHFTHSFIRNKTHLKKKKEKNLIKVVINHKSFGGLYDPVLYF